MFIMNFIRRNSSIWCLKLKPDYPVIKIVIAVEKLIQKLSFKMTTTRKKIEQSRRYGKIRMTKEGYRSVIRFIALEDTNVTTL